MSYGSLAFIAVPIARGYSYLGFSLNAAIGWRWVTRYIMPENSIGTGTVREDFQRPWRCIKVPTRHHDRLCSAATAVAKSERVGPVTTQLTSDTRQGRPFTCS